MRFFLTRSSVPAPAIRIAAAVVLVLVAGCAAFSQDETANWTAEKLYEEAKEQMTASNWQPAIKYLEKITARFPYGRIAQQAQIELVYAHWKDQEPALALAAADRFIKEYPHHTNIDYVYYMKGLINFTDNLGIFSFLADSDLSDRDPKAALESYSAFRELVTRLPESRYAPDARARMLYLVDALARYELHAARYYIKRGAYLAAANRAQYAVRTYPRAPAVEEALAVMIAAYRALELETLRADAERVLQKNFPDSAYLKTPLGLPRSAPWWKPWDPDW